MHPLLRINGWGFELVVFGSSERLEMYISAENNLLRASLLLPWSNRDWLRASFLNGKDASASVSSLYIHRRDALVSSPVKSSKPLGNICLLPLRNKLIVVYLVAAFRSVSCTNSTVANQPNHPWANMTKRLKSMNSISHVYLLVHCHALAI
jgi:hypothetical protein